MPTPQEILQQMRRPPVWDGWVPTFSGKGYRPWADDPGPLSLEDIGYGLAHTYRYGGQSSPVVTVAEHCVLVARIIRNLWGNKALIRAGLLHDASESVLHDIQAPLRRHVHVTLPSGEVIPWTASDLLVTKNIVKYYGVTDKDLESPEVRAADILAACFEKRDCPNLKEGDWGLPEIPKEIAFLRIFSMSPEVALQQFNIELHSVGLA